jgi:hypothetical protein
MVALQEGQGVGRGMVMGAGWQGLLSYLAPSMADDRVEPYWGTMAEQLDQRPADFAGAIEPYKFNPGSSFSVP